MNKDHIKQTMLALSEEELEHATRHYQRFLLGTRLDPTEPIENDEEAQARFQGQLAEAFEQPLHAAEDKIGAISQLDFGPRDRVEAGAVVSVDGRHFVIGVSTGKFICEGIEMMGLSPSAPFFQAIKGLKAGEMAMFRGRDVVIRAVY